MDNNLNELLIKHKLNSLYLNNLFSIKSICQELGIWESYTQYQKFALENLTEQDSTLNKNFTYQGKYNKELTYGEIQRDGVSEIISRISKYKDILEKDVFLDIGSGAGKLVSHISLVSNFKTVVGVEIVKERYLYSKRLFENLEVSNKNTFFINKDIKDFDVSLSTVVFMNDVAFGEPLRRNIFERISKGTHIITFREIKECKFIKDVFPVAVSWSKTKPNLYYYIK